MAIQTCLEQRKDLSFRPVNSVVAFSNHMLSSLVTLFRVLGLTCTSSSRLTFMSVLCIRAFDVCAESEALLVVGSSVMVYSAYRLVRAAKENGAKIAIVNVGETRADDLCDLKVAKLLAGT